MCTAHAHEYVSLPLIPFCRMEVITLPASLMCAVRCITTASSNPDLHFENRIHHSWKTHKTAMTGSKLIVHPSHPKRVDAVLRLTRLCSVQVKSYGIQNVLALRGDPPKGQESFTTIEGGFSCALDLVKFIRCAASSEDLPFT